MSTRKKLLNELKKSFGDTVSGELLSSKFNISRAAVSKHINTLKKSGYCIESSPKKGYRLTSVSDLLLPDEISDNLPTDIFGKKDIYYYEFIDSTNNKAKLIAAEGAPEGSIVVAEYQSDGRGRKGRSWLSSTSEGICISLILRPVIPPTEVSKITLMTAVAIAETLLNLTDIDVKIKWPNDILVNGKKLAGILTEMSMEIDAIDYVVVGLGLNINTDADSFADEVKEIATSIKIETGTFFSRVEIIKEFLSTFEAHYLDVQKNGFASILSRWKELSDIIGKTASVVEAGLTIDGRIMDIAEDGTLILKDDAGKLYKIISGDVLMR